MFYQLRGVLSTENLRVVYLALAESVISYGILAWGGLYEENVKGLKVMQNTLLKILFGKNRRHSTEQLYAELEALNVRQLYTYRCLLWMFDNKNKTPIPLHGQNTRCAEHLRAPFFQRTHFQRFVFYQGPKIFNLLQPEVRGLTNRRKFKQNILTYIHSNYDLLNNTFKQ